MAYGVLNRSIAALNIDAWNRHAVSASAVENGSIVVLASKSATAGEGEVWTATEPATGALTQLWMAFEPEIPLTAAKYKGLDVDPRNFRNEAGDIFSVYKPAVGDVVTMSADCLLGTYSAGVTTRQMPLIQLVIFLYSPNCFCFIIQTFRCNLHPIGSGAIDNQM
jgi:hypothetical protein